MLIEKNIVWFAAGGDMVVDRKIHISFSILVNLLHNKKYDNKYVVLKPMISVIGYSKEGYELINNLISEFKLKQVIYKKEFKVRINEKRELYELRLQDFKGIEHFIKLIKVNKGNYEFDESSLNTFIKIFNKIKLIGHVHKKWNDEMIDVLLLKETLNSQHRTRRGFIKESWEKRIKKHFE